MQLQSELSATRAFKNSMMAQVFDGYPTKFRKDMYALRELILATAASVSGVGEIEETLKWGEPAYLTSKSKSGSTIRIDWKKSWPDQYAMYCNCQTTLVESFRTLFPTELRFEENRALLFGVGSRISKDAVAFCVTAALKHHLRKGARHAGSGRNGGA